MTARIKSERILRIKSVERAVIDCTVGVGVCILKLLTVGAIGAVYDRPNKERAVIDCACSGNGNGSRSGSGAPESLNIEHVAVYDRPNQVRKNLANQVRRTCSHRLHLQWEWEWDAILRPSEAKMRIAAGHNGRLTVPSIRLTIRSSDKVRVLNEFPFEETIACEIQVSLLRQRL